MYKIINNIKRYLKKKGLDIIKKKNNSKKNYFQIGYIYKKVKITKKT